MQKRFILAAVALLAMAATAQAETLKEVQDKIHDMVSKYKTLQFKMNMNSEMGMAGYTAKTKSDSTIEAMRKDNVVMSRLDTQMHTVSKMGDQETKMDMKSLMIDDGKFVWTIAEAPMKSISKSKHDESTAVYFNPRAAWKLSEQHFDLKLMPDENMDGKSCWVIAMEPKDPSMKMMQSKAVNYFDKKTGLGVKTINYGPDGKKNGEVIMSDVKIDADISADRFKYTPPADAKVEDLTKAGDGESMGGKAGKGDKSDDSNKE